MMKWNNPLSMDEIWLNSDREILGRVRQEMGKQGILLTVTLPNGEDFQAEVEKLNADSGSTYCNMCREYFDEWKTGKEAASRRKQRDRELAESVGGPEPDVGGERGTGSLSIPETVKALEETVQGTSSFEEETLRRLDAAHAAAAKLRGMRQELDRDIAKVEQEVAQLEQVKEIFDASRVLEAASGSILVPSEDQPGSYETVDSQSRRAEDDTEAGEGAEQGSEGAES
jgi:hypothetical protein